MPRGAAELGGSAGVDLRTRLAWLDGRRRRGEGRGRRGGHRGDDDPGRAPRRPLGVAEDARRQSEHDDQPGRGGEDRLAVGPLRGPLDDHAIQDVIHDGAERARARAPRGAKRRDDAALTRAELPERPAPGVARGRARERAGLLQGLAKEGTRPASEARHREAARSRGALRASLVDAARRARRTGRGLDRGEVVERRRGGGKDRDVRGRRLEEALLELAPGGVGGIGSIGSPFHNLVSGQGCRLSSNQSAFEKDKDLGAEAPRVQK